MTEGVVHLPDVGDDIIGAFYRPESRLAAK
jgi:hypothetical protein